MPTLKYIKSKFFTKNSYFECLSEKTSCVEIRKMTSNYVKQGKSWSEDDIEKVLQEIHCQNSIGGTAVKY